jgi:Zn-dependent oligopeptidase
LHSQVGEGVDCVKLSNQILSESFLPVPQGASPATCDSHLVTYDASFYSYLWSESIAADILTVFRAAPGGLLDRNIGMRLRHEIFEPGPTRDASESVEKFLGRPYSTEPFLKELGLSHP